jgi:hypothetical protein
VRNDLREDLVLKLVVHTKFGWFLHCVGPRSVRGTCGNNQVEGDQGPEECPLNVGHFGNLDREHETRNSTTGTIGGIATQDHWARLPKNPLASAVSEPTGRKPRSAATGRKMAAAQKKRWAAKKALKP